MSDTPMTDDPTIAALLRERNGYVVRGLDDRVAAVDEQLAIRGYAGSRAEAGEGKPPVRRQRPRSTADQQPKGGA